MTCDEFERVVAESEEARSFEQEEHLRSCSQCSDLLSDVNAIAQQARLLRGSEEPSPRVWRNIELELREEGIIRGPSAHVPSWSRWKMGWLVPVAATLLIASGILLYQRQNFRPAASSLVAQNGPALVASRPADEDELLNIVDARSPASRAAYESDLRAVDAYIHDAEVSAHDNPNDEIAQQYLMNAYEQKAMVYQIAMERSLQ